MPIPMQDAVSRSLFADEFSKKIMAYLQREDGAIVQINKALNVNGPSGMGALTRLFNGMTDLSLDVQAIEFKNTMEVDNLEPYVTHVTLNAGKYIFNEDFTDVTPEIRVQFPRIDEIERLCEHAGVSLVDMLLKGICALHSQCFADGLTHDEARGNQDTIRAAVARMATLEHAQADVSRASLYEERVTVAMIDPDELKQSLQTVRTEIYASKQLLQRYAFTEFGMTVSVLDERLVKEKRELYLSELEPATRVKCEAFFNDYKVLDTQNNRIDTAYERVYNADTVLDPLKMAEAAHSLCAIQHDLKKIEIIPLLKLMDVLKNVQYDLEKTMISLLTYNDLLLQLNPHENSGQREKTHRSIELIADRQEQLLETVTVVNQQNVSEKIEESLAIIAAIKQAMLQIEPIQPHGLFSPLMRLINRLSEVIFAFFSPMANQLVSLKYERQDLVDKMLSMKNTLKKMQQDTSKSVAPDEVSPEIIIDDAPHQGGG